MPTSQPRSIGILAGGGNLPIEIAASLKARGIPVHVIAIEGEADSALADLHPTYVKWGQVGRIVSSLKKAGCTSLVIVGSVTRPDLGALTPDLGLFLALVTILRLVRAGGDDAVLRGVITFFEQRGITIVGPADVVPELLIAAGPFAQHAASPKLTPDVALGFKILEALAPFDVCQSVVISGCKLECVEDAEGTDAMIARVSKRRRLTQDKRFGDATGILVKRPKPGQELRVDLPVIGPRTVMGCVEANLAGIAVEAARVIAVDRDELRAFADAHHVFVQGYNNPNATPAIDVEPEPMTIRTIGKMRASRQAIDDARKGAQVLEALNRFETGRVVVVSRGHVLALEASQGRMETIERAASLRQWGDRRWRKRAGVVVLAAGRDADEDTINKAAQTGLAGVVVCLTKFSATVTQPMIKLANRNNIFIAEALPGTGGRHG